MKRISSEIPLHLPKKYFRECADEDGVITKYRVVTHKESYLEGAQAQLEACEREAQENLERTLAINNISNHALTRHQVQEKVREIFDGMGTTFLHGFEIRYLHESEYQALKQKLIDSEEK